MNPSDLEKKTLVYWSVSATFYGIDTGINMTTHDALQICGDTASELGPHRRLKHNVLKLNDRIVQGRGRRRKTPKHPNNVVLLKKATA